MGLTFEPMETMHKHKRCDSVFSGYDFNNNLNDEIHTEAATEILPSHMAFEQVFDTYELGQLVFSFLSAKDLLNAQRACSRFHTHVQVMKNEFTLSDSINRFVTNGPTRYTRMNFLNDLLCPQTTMKHKYFNSIHQLPSADSKPESQKPTYEPWRDMVFTRPPTSTVHVLTGTTALQPFLPSIKSAEDIQTTAKIMPDYSCVVNPSGVTLGEVIDAAELGNAKEPFAVILGDVEESEIAEARREFRDMLRRERKMRDIAVLRSAQLMFSDW